MDHLGDPALHFYMTRAIARMLDVSLGDALREGRLTTDDYERMVTRCRRCVHAQRCAQMLATTVDLDSPPDRCPNNESFLSLRLH